MSFGDNKITGVCVDGKWGFINKSGKMVIEPQFSDVDSFASNGLALVEVGGGAYGYINDNGKFAINPKFDQAMGFNYSDGFTVVLFGEDTRIIKKNGKYLGEESFDNIRLSTEPYYSEW